jgi:hypothetical protein
MTDKERINSIEKIVNYNQKNVEYIANNLSQSIGVLGNRITFLSNALNVLLPYIPYVGKLVNGVFIDSLTEIEVTPLKYNLKTNDVIDIIDLDTLEIVSARVSENISVGSTTISIESVTFTSAIQNGLVMFSMVRDSAHKLEIEH